MIDKYQICGRIGQITSLHLFLLNGSMVEHNKIMPVEWPRSKPSVNIVLEGGGESYSLHTQANNRRLRLETTTTTGDFERSGSNAR